MASFYFHCQANFFLDFLDYLKPPLLKIGMDLFHFFEKWLFRFKNNEEITKNKTVVLKAIIFKNVRRFVNKS